MISFCPEEKLEEKVFFYFEVCFNFLPFSAEIFERFGEKRRGLCCQNRVLNVHGIFSRERFLPKKLLFFVSISNFQQIFFGLCIFFHFWTSTKFFGIYFEPRMSKLYSKCAEELFEETINFEKLNYFFWIFIKNLSAFYRKLFNGNLNNAFYLSREKLWGRIYFFKI